MRRILMIIGGLVVVCIAFFAFTFGLAWRLTSGVASAGDAFMTALQNEDMDAAYAMFSTALQDEVSLEEFNVMFAENVFAGDSLESWSFTSRNVENNTGDVSGTATIGGRVFAVTLHFIRDTDWKLSAYSFQPV